MSIKEMNRIKNKSIPYHVRLKMAIKMRDFGIAAKVLENKHSIDAFNNSNIYIEPDSIGITIYYPNKQSVTHMATEIFSVDVGEKEFAKQVKRMEKNLMKKARGGQ